MNSGTQRIVDLNADEFFLEMKKAMINDDSKGFDKLYNSDKFDEVIKAKKNEMWNLFTKHDISDVMDTVCLLYLDDDIAGSENYALKTVIKNGQYDYVKYFLESEDVYTTLDNIKAQDLATSIISYRDKFRFYKKPIYGFRKDIVNEVLDVIYDENPDHLNTLYKQTQQTTGLDEEICQRFLKVQKCLMKFDSVKDYVKSQSQVDEAQPPVLFSSQNLSKDDSQSILEKQQQVVPMDVRLTK